MTATLARLCVAAFLLDMALYLVMTGTPYKALALGAGPLVLGLLPAARALPYSLSTVWAGHVTETGNRLRVARWALLAAAAASAGLIWVSSIPPIFLMLGVIGVVLAFFWPPLQATLADLARPGQAGHLGWFNIAWSAGKGSGFLIGGLLLAGFGFTALFAAAAAATVIGALLIFTRVPVARSAVPEASDEHAVHPRLTRFRMAAWIGNAVSFGVASVLNYHYPSWLESTGQSETLFGGYLGLIFFSQTAMFGLLARYPVWRYRVWPVLGTQIPMIAVLVVLPRLSGAGWILATAPLVGLGLGTAYFASIYYSVAGSARGRNAGIHEAGLGIGSLAMPILGGWAGSLSGNLAAPYLVSAAVGVVAVLVQGVLLFGGGGRQGPAPGTEAPGAGYSS